MIGVSPFGNRATFGGGIYNDGIINITGTTFAATAPVPAAESNNNGTLTVTGSTFESNNSTQDGGGIYNTDTAAVSVSNSTFYFNFTSGIDSSRSASGGAIFNANALSVFDKHVHSQPCGWLRHRNRRRSHLQQQRRDCQHQKHHHRRQLLSTRSAGQRCRRA